MLASFLLSLVAGALTVVAEPLLKAGIRRINDADLRFDALELRILSFGLMLLLASVVTALIGADSSAYMAVAGGLIGYFAQDALARLRATSDDRDEPVDLGADIATAAFAAGDRPVRPTPAVPRASSGAGIDDAVLYSESPTPTVAGAAAEDLPVRPSPRVERLRAVTRTMRGGGEEQG